jgi:hypothetical protein
MTYIRIWKILKKIFYGGRTWNFCVLTWKFYESTVDPLKIVEKVYLNFPLKVTLKQISHLKRQSKLSNLNSPICSVQDVSQIVL